VVRLLYRWLAAQESVKPWLDEEELLPGQDWEREIRNAVRAADLILVCLSRGSASRAGFVQREIRFALDVAKEQPPGTIFIIPVRLEECEVPEELRRWQWFDYYNPGGYKRLLRALAARAEALGLGPAPVFEIEPQFDAIAPDGAAVRLLVQGCRGSLSDYQLSSETVGQAIRHRTVEEIWYFTAGVGELWLHRGDGEERRDLRPGVAVVIQPGTGYQLRALGPQPLRFIIATMPPWPGEGEAETITGGLWTSNPHLQLRTEFGIPPEQ
jgi:mannose-6-phosphate isomerase-like protein (cupin superfamily)